MVAANKAFAAHLAVVKPGGIYIFEYRQSSFLSQMSLGEMFLLIVDLMLWVPASLHLRGS